MATEINFEEFVEYSDELYEMIGLPVPSDASLMQAYRQQYLVEVPEYRNHHFVAQGYLGVRGGV